MARIEIRIITSTWTPLGPTRYQAIAIDRSQKVDPPFLRDPVIAMSIMCLSYPEVYGEAEVLAHTLREQGKEDVEVVARPPTDAEINAIE